MVFRVEKNKNYTVMSNLHLREKEMSLKAKGLLSWMLSNSDDWDYSINGIVSNCKENVTAITNILKELISFGYLEINKLMPESVEDENGNKVAVRSRIEYEYIIHETPIQKDENQATDNQGIGFLGVENNIQRNTNNEINTKQTNNNISSKEDILTENFDFGKKENKPRKTKNNLYIKCSSLIYNFTDIPALQKLLFTWLNMRLEIKNKPLYANQFKGILNKLGGYTESATELCEIVQQSIDRGYLSFFPVNNYKQGKSTHDAIHESGSGVVVNDTKEDAEKREQFRAKMEAEGKKAVF